MRKNKFIIPILGMTAGVAAITPMLVSCAKTKKAPGITLVGPRTAELSAGQSVEIKGEVTGDFELYNYFGEDICTIVIAPYTIATDDELAVVCEDIIINGVVSPGLTWITKDGKFDFSISIRDSVVTGSTVKFQLWLYLQTKNDLIKFKFQTYEYRYLGE